MGPGSELLTIEKVTAEIFHVKLSKKDCITNGNIIHIAFLVRDFVNHSTPRDCRDD